MAWSEKNYWQTVQGIAEDAMAEYPGMLPDLEQYVSESVDGSEYVVYYGANEFVLRASQNEPDDGEVCAMSTTNANWRTMRSNAARLAMEADVFEEINRITNS
jgi:hypothetical protein